VNFVPFCGDTLEPQPKDFPAQPAPPEEEPLSDEV
jgi:hypothetical protein